MFTKDSQKKYILFICKANVGRSQMAEGLYNNLYGTGRALSLAGCEARKDIYAGRPAESIQYFMLNHAKIDISNQKIQYISDISESVINEIEEIIFLYDPIKESSCDLVCLKGSLSPYDYFRNRNITIRIFPIPDPFEQGEMSYESIYNSIKFLVCSL